MHTSPTNSAQPSDPNAPAEISNDSQEEQQSAPTNQETGAHIVVTPFVHPLMVPQFNTLYNWPYLHPAINPFAPFPIGPQLQVPYFPWPYPIMPWYYSQQSMMSIPGYAQAMTFGVHPTSITPQSSIVQSTNTCPATSITNNFVTHNEIGNDSSTNLRIHKNGHRNTDSG